MVLPMGPCDFDGVLYAEEWLCAGRDGKWLLADIEKAQREIGRDEGSAP